MDLKGHLELLKHDVDLFSYKTKLPREVIQAAIDGRPVAAVHATKIAQQLSNEHGMSKRQGFDVSDIDGLQVIHPDELRT